MKILRHSLSLHPLAACLALVFGAPAAEAVAPHPAFVVQNCLDHGPGSLRQAVIDDTTSEPIDLTQLTCSGITLTTGSINVQRAQLIQGPGAALFTVDGAGLDRVFSQTSTQPLALYGMTIQNGYTDSGGGCIYTAGPLQLNDTVVRDCRVHDTGTSLKGGGVRVHGALIAIHSSIVDNKVSSDYSAFGGGAFVDGVAVLDHSTISGNLASTGSSVAFAGGIEADGGLTMMYSTVSNNRAQGVPGYEGSYGGILARGGAITITQSTISGNSVDGEAGGLELVGSATAPIEIIDSTISGNTAFSKGGLKVFGPTSIKNSTIAFNTETGSILGAGLYVGYGVADIQSTIIAANTSSGGSAQNVGTNQSVTGPGSVTGANNLIGSSPSVTLPPDTIGGDPRLLPLHDNGGWTKTHALRPGSPAVDAGNDNGYTTDQRGTGFPRVIGSAADIGAFEGVDADSIFYSGFD